MYGPARSACCDDCAGHSRGLGLDPGTAVAIGSAAVKLFGGGSNPRRGGADPCCMPGFDPPYAYPTNSGVDGAPPDYRTKGPPFLSSSPNGGRLKDDYCDCFAISYRGSSWVLGEVRNGKVYTGTPRNYENGVWVEVDRQLNPIRVPGVGAVQADAPSGGGSAGGGVWTPPINPADGLPQQFGGGGFQAPKNGAGTPSPSPSVFGDTPPALLGIGAVGVALLLAAAIRGGS